MAMKALAVLLADVVNGADVGMVQCGSSLRLALEAGESLRVSATSSGRNFSATKRCKPRVFSLVDHTHPAAAQLLDDAVMRDGLSDHRREANTGLQWVGARLGEVNAGRGQAAGRVGILKLLQVRVPSLKDPACFDY